ncbi:MAG: phosphatidate cytidylyltransferase [Vicinamibacterales bacterium]
MTRVLSAGVLIAVVVGTVWLAPVWATVALAAIAAALAGGELARLAGAVDAAIPPVFLGAASAVVCVAFASRPWLAAGGGLDVLELVILAVVIAGGAMSLSSGRPGPATLTRAGVAVMGPLYVGLPLGAIASIRVLNGAAAVFWLLLVVAVSDSAQYYVGRLAGRRRLAPVVSPAKTVEGAFGGLAAATIAGALSASWLGAPFTAPIAALVAFFVAAFGIVGDLFESLLKRSAAVKDSSSLIPGHGGVLDRVDSYLFAAPCCYVVLRWLA